jgi:hypothetical protein
MELIVQTQDLAEAMAYDNMINAFISRLLNAVTERNTDLLAHYENEIRLATTAKTAILNKMRNDERPALYLIQ